MCVHASVRVSVRWGTRVYVCASVCVCSLALLELQSADKFIILSTLEELLQVLAQGARCFKALFCLVEKGKISKLQMCCLRWWRGQSIPALEAAR